MTPYFVVNALTILYDLFIVGHVLNGHICAEMDLKNVHKLEIWNINVCLTVLNAHL